jgi:hypothetical protein
VPAQRPDLRRPEARDVAAAKQDGARRRLDQPQDAAAERGLPAPGFAHQAQGLAAAEIERDVGHGTHLPDRAVEEDAGADREVLHQIAHRQDRLVGLRR